MKYYVRSGNKTYGPVEENKIRAKIAKGFFSPDCMVSVDRQEWKPLPTETPRPTVSAFHKAAAAFSGGSDAAAAPPPRIRMARPIVDDGGDDVGAAGPQPEEEEPVMPRAVDDGDSRSFKFRSLAICGSFLISLIIVIVGASFGYKVINNSGKSTGTSAPVGRRGPGGRKKTSVPSQPKRPQPDKSQPGKLAQNFEEVCANYQNAVGVVVVTLEDSDGKLLTKIGGFDVNCYEPIGTAFAVAGNKFVTNCHVAYGIKDQKSDVVNGILARIVIVAARKSGVKTEDQLNIFIERNKDDIEKVRRYLQEKVRVRNVEIRLSHSDGKSLQVTGVQIHPRYKADSNETGNAEFDVAILTTAKSAPVYFRRADTQTLHQLSPGRKVAYLGFPMEGLSNDGGLNINKPEATFKDGTINKVTDFNNVHGEAKNNKSITHSIPATGGASGSPIFLENGEVVAVLWGGSISIDGRGNRTASAAQHNFAVRIDSLDMVEEEKIHDINSWLGGNKK